MTRAHLRIPGLPAPLEWAGAIESSAAVIAGGLSMETRTTSDLFCDPQGNPPVLNAPRLLFRPDRQFTLSAQIDAGLQSTYDAAALMVFVHDGAWAKLCCEYSPQQTPMIVSVVTSGRSDDANAVTLAQPRVFLRVTGLGRAFAFHYSTDGAFWHMVRYFSLPDPEQARIGFSVQAPVGTACRAEFSSIRYTAASVADIRSGQ